MVIISGDTGIDKVQSGSITPEDLVQKMTLMTSQTASGTSVDFTGIPSWAKRVTVMFDGVSTNGTSIPCIQLGSGGIENTGYKATGVTSGNAASPSVSNQITTWFPLGNSSAASDIRSGSMELSLLGNNIWCAKAMMSLNSVNIMYSTGTKTLSGALDRIRITTVNGTDTFDAGSINVMYEG